MKKDTRVAAGAAALAALVAVGIYFFTREAPEPAQPPLVVTPPDRVAPQPEQQQPPPTTLPKTTPTAATVTIYREDPGDEKTEPRLVEATVPLPPGQEPMAFALNAMAQDKASPLPTATRVNSVKVTKGIARIDFNRAFAGPADGGNFNGGSTGEGLVLDALMKTMAQFPQVKQVQVVVEGKPIESLGGHIDWSGPMPVGEDTAMTAQGEEQ